jgi:hypothetical protein
MPTAAAIIRAIIVLRNITSLRALALPATSRVPRQIVCVAQKVRDPQQKPL